MKTPGRKALCGLLAALALVPATDGTVSLDWYTVDCGGGWSTGGDLELFGTIGQPDASIAPMSGANLGLRGGFGPWPCIGPIVCPGDLNCDGHIDFGDINPFVLALSNWSAWLATYPECPPENADINGDGQYGGPNGFGDINPFVELLAGSGGHPIPCP